MKQNNKLIIYFNFLVKNGVINLDKSRQPWGYMVKFVFNTTTIIEMIENWQTSSFICKFWATITNLFVKWTWNFVKWVGFSLWFHIFLALLIHKIIKKDWGLHPLGIGLWDMVSPQILNWRRNKLHLKVMLVFCGQTCRIRC